MKVHIDKAMGRPISEARIGRIMKRLNLCAIVRRKNPYRQRVKQWQEELPQNILNREFDADAPGEKFVTDDTYIPYVEGYGGNSFLDTLGVQDDDATARQI